VSWKDRNGLGARAVYAAVRGSFRMRTFARELRNVSGLTAASIVLVILTLAFRSWILLGGFAFVLILAFAQWLYFRHYIERAQIEDVDEMTGWEFERWLGNLFEQLGFKVEQTPYRGDFGADFILTWNQTRIAAQAKRASRPVGVRAVQEVVAAKSFYRCQRAMVVTNNYFTEQAMLLGRANGVLMRTRDDLARGAAGLRGSEELPPEQRVPEPETQTGVNS
jgi:restriction system protein